MASIRSMMPRGQPALAAKPRRQRLGRFHQNEGSGHRHRILLSGRALARAPLGGGFIQSRPFGCGWVPQFHHRSRFQPPSPKIPYVGFSHSTASSIRHRTVRYGAFRSSAEVKADPAMPPVGFCVYSALRRHHPPIDRPPLCAETSAAPSPPEPRGPRSDRVVLSRPSTLGDLIRQSGELPAISRLRRL